LPSIHEEYRAKYPKDSKGFGILRQEYSRRNAERHGSASITTKSRVCFKFNIAHWVTRLNNYEKEVASNKAKGAKVATVRGADFETITFTVMSLDGSTVDICLDGDNTQMNEWDDRCSSFKDILVLVLKKIIETEVGASPVLQTLHLQTPDGATVLLEDGKCIGDYKVKEGDVVLLTLLGGEECLSIDVPDNMEVGTKLKDAITEENVLVPCCQTKLDQLHIIRSQSSHLRHRYTRCASCC
jgi:hypothetical protein